MIRPNNDIKAMEVLGGIIGTDNILDYIRHLEGLLMADLSMSAKVIAHQLLDDGYDAGSILDLIDTAKRLDI